MQLLLSPFDGERLYNLSHANLGNISEVNILYIKQLTSHYVLP
ncbi:hypothetical protein ENHY17A_100019 [Moraxellaceae bacterium 17A]|nr:hypothetical protein ENHY17A_100019 [Moraxellaceae bacterium 17A]